MQNFLEQLHRVIDLANVFMAYGVVESTPFNLLVYQVEDLKTAYADVATLLEKL